MKSSKRYICLLSLLVTSNLFAVNDTKRTAIFYNSFSHEINCKFKTNSNQYFEKQSDVSGEPIYNLFYLARAISTKTNSLDALGYLNYLAQNSKSDTLLISSLQKNLSNNIREELKIDLNNYFKSVLGVDAKFDGIEKKYKGIFSGRNAKIKNDIEELNKIIYAYRNVDIITPVKDFIFTNSDGFIVDDLSDDFFEKNVEILSNTIFLDSKQYKEIIKNFNYIKDPNKKAFKAEYDKLSNSNLNVYSFIKYYKSYYSTLSDSRNRLVNNLVNNYLDNLIAYEEKGIFQIDQNQINAIIHETRRVVQENNQEISGFRVPSQTDIINSVAQFMANRAKQETMIWFVQYLQREIQNPLLWDAFPETKEVLETFDLDRLKDLNDNWRTSLSSDFVKMPTNLINSSWLENQAVNNNRLSELQNIKATVKSVNYFQKLINERHNYRSILKNFYEKGKESDFYNNQQHLKDITALLYIVSNEFYTIYDKKMYYITSEQINNISEEQWKDLLNLIEIKYGVYEKQVFQNIFTDKLNTSKQKQLANLLSDFSQLDALSKATLDENHPSFILAWNKMIDLLKYVDPNYDVTNDRFNSDMYSEIDQLQILYKIGQQIVKKDFKAVTQNTITFIKPIFSNSNYTINIQDNTINVFSKASAKPIKIVDANKIKRTKIECNNVTISFEKNKENKIKIVGETEKYFTISELKNEIKSAKIAIASNELVNFKANGNSFLSMIFKENSPSLDSKIDEENIQNSLILANLLVDLAENPLKIMSNSNYEVFDIQFDDFQGSFKNNAINKLLKTTTIFSEIINAKDEKEVYSAIEDMFSPKESYMIKRKNKSTFTVNGYVGLFAGYQFVQSQPSDYKNSFIYGVTAPIGLTYSGKRFGTFVQFLELGNLVNHYLWSSSDYSHKQKVSIKELFSPGVKFLFNIPKTPFVAYTGADFVQVDKYLNNQQLIVNNRAIDLIQWTIGFKIDIPFYTVFKKN